MKPTTKQALAMKLCEGAIAYRDLTCAERNELKKLDVKVINGMVIRSWEVR
jgi:hypothetical protein